MITYPKHHNYLPELTAEMRERTQGLPLYQGGPAVDYTDAPHAYALCATLLHDRNRSPDELLKHGPSKDAQVMLVERASGHGVVGAYGGVTGYIDTLYPKDDISQGAFDPVAHTLREEFETECGFDEPQFELVKFHAGTPFVENRTVTPDAKISVVPIIGLCVEKPKVVVDPAEISTEWWVDLNLIGYVRGLAEGYLASSLPGALGAMGVQQAQVSEIIQRR